MSDLDIHTEIVIHAPANKVWAVLLDFDSYGEWNPFMRKIIGEPKVGKKLRVEMKLEDGREFLAKPKVLKNEENVELRWIERLYFKGLYDGEHFFQLEELNKNQVKLIHGQSFSGALAKALLKKLGDDTEEGFKAMNKALKKRVAAVRKG